MTEYIPKGDCGDCGQELPGSLCELIAELKAMKDRINEMITQVQGIGPDAQGHVRLPFSEDIGDSTLGVSGTFAGGHAVLQVKGIADNADETAHNAQDIAQIAADAANAADSKASIANSKAWEAFEKASVAGEDARFALRAAEEAQAAVGNSVMGIGPSVAEETQVRVPYRLKDGTQGVFLVPAVDPDSAGVLTPAQFMEVTDHLDTLGRDLNNVRAEYLDKFNLTAVQLVRSKTDWEKSPLVPTLKANEYALDDGKRALNAASARADPDLMKTEGEQRVNTDIINYGEYINKAPNVDINDQFYRETPATRYTDMHDKLMARTFSWITDGGIGSTVETMNSRTGQKAGLDTTVFDDGTTMLVFIRTNGERVTLIPRG